jgi:hypothetical protein
MPQLAFLLLAACVRQPTITPTADQLILPESLTGRVEVLPGDDPDATAAGLDNAVKARGDGGISSGFVVQLTEDIVVYRMWSGPDVLDDAGRTSRLGSWWSSDPLAGPVENYRVDYEVCEAWNELTWTAQCTLRAGAVVAAGPGQSVSDQTCGLPGESYPPSPAHWQLYIDQFWTRGEELDCTDTSTDYPARPEDISLSVSLPDSPGISGRRCAARSLRR